MRKLTLTLVAFICLATTPTHAALSPERYSTLLTQLRAICLGGSKTCSDAIQAAAEMIVANRSLSSSAITDGQLGGLVSLMIEVSQTLTPDMTAELADVLVSTIVPEIEDAIAAEAALTISTSLENGVPLQDDVVAELSSTN